MIDYFVGSMAGVRTRMGRSDWETFAHSQSMGFRTKPAGVVVDQLGEGGLNLLADCAAAAAVARGPFKFTVTSPYMLARTLVDNYYRDFETLTMGIAQGMGMQVAGLVCACLQVDEANITGKPSDSELAARAINLLLDHVTGEKAVHLCFRNYVGHTIQKGEWRSLIEFVNCLHVDHLVLELACRPEEDRDPLKDGGPKVKPRLGWAEGKSNRGVRPGAVASHIDMAENLRAPC